MGWEYREIRITGQVSRHNSYRDEVDDALWSEVCYRVSRLFADLERAEEFAGLDIEVQGVQEESDELDDSELVYSRRDVDLLLQEQQELVSANVELKTLRGIAKRLADGWVPIEVALEWATVTPYVSWENQERERMTVAEVRAIYGDDPASVQEHYEPRKIRDNPQA